MADDREGGFIVVHRKIRSSRLFRSLTGEQRSVFFQVLILANWKPDAILVGSTWHEVKRGELAHSLETIAKEAAVSVKVVRTTLAKMFADDRPAGGRGPFLTERYVGTETGTARRILTVVNYDEYQSIGQDEGTQTGSAGARQGHETGTTGAPREPVEPREPDLETLSPPARERAAVPALAPAASPALPPRPRAADGLPKNHVERFKASLELLDVLEAGGWTVGLPKAEPERLAVEEAVRAVTVPVAAERLLAMVAAQRAAGNVPSPWLGWHKAVILGRPEGESQARAPPTPAKRVIAKAASAADMAGGEHGFRR